MQVMIVAGGSSGGLRLDSVEMLESAPSSVWRFVAALPHKMSGLRGSTLLNSFYVTGGRDRTRSHSGQSPHLPLNLTSPFCRDFPVQLDDGRLGQGRQFSERKALSRGDRGEGTLLLLS